MLFLDKGYGDRKILGVSLFYYIYGDILVLGVN